MPFRRGFWGWGAFDGPYEVNPWRCRWFPGRPRWWWFGIGRQINPFQIPQSLCPLTPLQELEMFKGQAEILKTEIEDLDKQLEEITRRIAELEVKTKNKEK